MAPFKEEVFNVILDGQATGVACVIPGEVHAGKSGAETSLGRFHNARGGCHEGDQRGVCRRILCQSRRRLGRRGLGATCGARGLGWSDTGSNPPC